MASRISLSIHGLKDLTSHVGLWFKDNVATPSSLQNIVVLESEKKQESDLKVPYLIINNDNDFTVKFSPYTGYYNDGFENLFGDFINVDKLCFCQGVSLETAGSKCLHPSVHLNSYWVDDYYRVDESNEKLATVLDTMIEEIMEQIPGDPLEKVIYVGEMVDLVDRFYKFFSFLYQK